MSGQLRIPGDQPDGGLSRLHDDVLVPEDRQKPEGTADAAGRVSA